MKKIILIFAFVFLGFAEKKPLVLSLSGGGARGFAHIGVLKYFEERGVVPDTIIGTSMGAVVAALYSCGYLSDEIYDILRVFSYTDVLFQKPDAEFLRDNRSSSVLKLQIDKNLNFVLPLGFISSRKLDEIIAPKIISAQIKSGGDFDKLPIPLRIVTTDILQNKPQIHKSGDIYQTAKASAAVPGILPPVKLGGSWHVDGGLRANIPLLDDVKLGGSFVFAVNTTSDEEKEISVNTFADIVILSMTMGMEDEALRNAEFADIVISPLENMNIKNYHFHLFDDIFIAGYAAAKRAIENSDKMDVYMGNYRTFDKNDNGGFFAKGIKFDGLKKTKKGYLQRITSFNADEKITEKKIERIIKTANSIDFFDDFYFTSSNDTLIANVREKSGFGVDFGIRFDNRNLVEVFAVPLFNNLFGLGISQGYEFQLGFLRKKMLADISWYLPLNRSFLMSLGFSGYMSSQRLVSREVKDTAYEENYAVYAEKEIIYYSESDIVKNGINLVGSFDFLNSVSLFGGFRNEFYISKQSRIDDVEFDFTNQNNKIAMLFAGIKADWRDDRYFPSYGGEHRFWFSGASDYFASDYQFLTVNEYLSFVIPIGELHAIIPLVFGTWADQTLPNVMRYYIGGSRNADFVSPTNVLYTVSFAGLREREIFADNFFMFQLCWRYRFTKKYPLYFSLYADFGNTWNYSNVSERYVSRDGMAETFFHNIPIGVETELGLKTPFGPVRFSWSRLVAGKFYESFDIERKNIFKFSAGFDF